MTVVLAAHRWAAYAVLLALVGLMVAGLVLRLARAEESPVAYRAAQHWTENLLVLQVVLGLVLLVGGYRLSGGDAWLHYLYGSVFPFVAVIGGRIAALRRDRYEYVGTAWGAFFALGLVSRAVLLGLESTGRALFELL